tara:strand:+ start:92 stop:1069 length:978 start_codon:yes stop_codon:yes gene_type:complete
MRFLVTGGAGYIGSHMVKYLQEKKASVMVIDNFSTGNPWSISNCEIIKLDLLDKDKLKNVLTGQKFDAVFHFAANSSVSESLKFPNKYLIDNLNSTKNLINQMLINGNHKLIFSSSASIYGDVPFKIRENTQKNPINAYGKSKLLCEELLENLTNVSKLKYISLRYFNAAGADKNNKIGEYHNPETHLIPSIFSSLNNNKPIKVYGDDYNTKDGTCIREFVHVSDLVDAHFKAFKKLNEKNQSDSFNLSSENAYSVLDIISYCQKIVGKKINYRICERRIGDPEILISDCSKAMKLLNWKPLHSDIENIIRSAWNWFKFHKKYLL